MIWILVFSHMYRYERHFGFCYHNPTISEAVSSKWVNTENHFKWDTGNTSNTDVSLSRKNLKLKCTVYPKKYAHGFVVLCFVVVMQSFIMNSHEVFIHINQGCFAGTGAIVRLPQCQWSKPDGYGKISQCITTTKHSKAKTRVHISWDILLMIFFLSHIGLSEWNQATWYFGEFLDCAITTCQHTAGIQSVKTS